MDVPVCRKCRKQKPRVLDYCQRCWEIHEPTKEEVEAVIKEQENNLPPWWFNEVPYG